MSIRLSLSGYLLALSAFRIAEGLPDPATSYGGIAVGLLLALTVALDVFHFGRG